ncbi:LPS translocon maturation chaperone LptM [Candidatus Odyssella acanthamoebae]|uniref:LPS translocon maturation chaperone LptM n=1 Tax=Candidatus Odyssella acanthamoebae TaxID=91604 RepID=UPI003B968B09
MSLKFLRFFCQLITLIILGTLLSACGRKGPPEPLNETDYPRQYPAQEPECDIHP